MSKEASRIDLFFSLNKKSSGREFQACFSASKSLQLASPQPSWPSSPLEHKMAAEAPSVIPPEDKAQGRKEEDKDSPPVSHQGGNLFQNTLRSFPLLCHWLAPVTCQASPTRGAGGKMKALAI